MFRFDSHSLSAPDGLRRRYKAYRRDGAEDPLLNPVRKLASDLFLALEAGSLSAQRVEDVVDQFDLDSFEARAREFHHRRNRKQSGLTDPLQSLAKLDFEAFRRRVEKTSAGVVFTAHPTFALGAPKRELIAQFPIHCDEDALSQWRAEAAALPPADEDQITLRDEHQQARAAIANAQCVIAGLNRKILECARERFPGRWSSLTPNPVSLASWVGYDLDGRTDIHWGESIRIRLDEKAAQLRRYAETLDTVLALGANERLQSLREEFNAAAELTSMQAGKFAGDLNDPDSAIEAANFLTHADRPRLVSIAPALETITHIIENETNTDKALALCVLRAEMNACGLGVARIHLRVNAAQVRSALKADLGLDPESGFAGRSALSVASRKAQSARQHAVNFGSVFLEQMTARRQFMLCAQILKHIDAETPIRFLIAECEAPATIMGALYLAKLYGVDDKLDVSPLFETPQALESGGRFIERLLEEPEYRDHVRARGRMTLQIGYSDSGRFMGQAAASLAAERLQVLFARALGRAKLGGVEALIFNTHGESLGRGAHPRNFRMRMNHLATPWVKNRFLKEGVDLNCEYSIQGGEGYLHFQTPALCADSIEMIWAHSNERPPLSISDRFYQDINYSWDFYRALKDWQEALCERDDYRRVLFGFAQNLLHKTGSRKAKRARRDSAAQDIRSMRAIPHNAVLQQLAAPSNVSGGVGAASGRETDRFIEHVRGSERMRELMAMCIKARELTSISVLRAYGDLYSPTYWSALAGLARKTNRSADYEAVLQVLLHDDAASSFHRLADYLARDLRAADSAFDKLGGDGADAPAAPSIDISVLHAIRQALIARAVALVARAPAFSRRHDIDRVGLINLALQLRLLEAANALREIFPKESPSQALMSGLKERIEGEDDHARAYPEIHADIIEPIEFIHALMRRISKSISNYYGAFG